MKASYQSGYFNKNVVYGRIEKRTLRISQYVSTQRTIYEGLLAQKDLNIGTYKIVAASGIGNMKFCALQAFHK
jgi:hypothetical protein